MISGECRILYFVTAHGYGHGVRSSDLLNALTWAWPDCSIHVVTDLPEAFMRNRVPSPRVTFSKGRYDVGMVQLDSIRVDVPATLERVQELMASATELEAGLVESMTSLRPKLVLSDIPSLPLSVASRLDIPCAAMGNFAWNWIYQPFAEQDGRWQEAVDWFASGYRQADLLLQLPFSEPMEVFKKREAIGLLASPGEDRRELLSELTGAEQDTRWVLLSFTTLDWDHEVASKVAAMEGYSFFTVEPLSWPGSGIYSVDRERVSFSDVMASVDGVVSKPGYGLLSDCVVNGKPLLYAERENFIEYPVLVEALEKYIVNQHIPSEDLYRGNLEPGLEALWGAAPPPEQLEADGCARAVDVLGEMVLG